MEFFVFVLLARLTLLFHLGFLLFVSLGGALVRTRDYVTWIHLPCVLWAVGISFFGWPCPLTDLEKWALNQANYPAYGGSFIEYYLISVIYPRGLTATVQYALGMFVVTINLYFYREAIVKA